MGGPVIYMITSQARHHVMFTFLFERANVKKYFCCHLPGVMELHVINLITNRTRQNKKIYTSVPKMAHFRCTTV
jgi:hypothetical protein